MELKYLDSWNKYYGFGKPCLFIELLKNKGFTDEDINDILEIVGIVCKHCYNEKDGCACWNDE